MQRQENCRREEEPMGEGEPVGDGEPVEERRWEEGEFFFLVGTSGTNRGTSRQ